MLKHQYYLESKPRVITKGRRKTNHYVLEDLIITGVAKSINKIDKRLLWVRELPPDMSTKDKGDLGELIGKLLLETQTGIEGIFTEPGSPFDMEIGSSKLDFKFSEIKSDKTGYEYWQFYLRYGKKDKVKGGYVKGDKDYSKTCTHLVFIGVNLNRTVSVFVIPSTDIVLTDKDSIKIPIRFSKSKWAKYLYLATDISTIDIIDPNQLIKLIV